MSILGDFKKKFAEEKANNSIHPLEFWLGVVDALYENRTFKKLDLFTPLGTWQGNWDVFGYLVKINSIGMEVDKNKGIEHAFAFYEIVIAEWFSGTYPYDRLRIWYTKNKNFKDVIRVCQTFLDSPHSIREESRSHFQHHLEKLKSKLDKLNRKA